jgi:hypothetical protein
MIYPRVFHGATLGPGGFIYAVGGAGSLSLSSTPTSRKVEKRDPVTGVWTQVASLSTAHPHQIGAVVADQNGQIYAMGGWNPGMTAAVERYDAGTNTWSPCTNLPVALNNPAAVRGGSGMSLRLPAGHSFRIVARAPTAGQLEVVRQAHGVIVFGWPGSTAEVFDGDRLVYEADVPVPDVPPGLSVRQFLDRMGFRPPSLGE